MRVTPEISLAGNFWLPDKPETQVFGMISVKDGGEILLELFGTFTKGVKAMMDRAPIDRVVGQVEKHGYATLEQCVYTHRNISFGGVSKCELHAQFLLLGAAFDQDEKIEINSLSFSVEGLDEWHAITGISIDTQISDNATTIKFRRPDPVDLWSANGISLSLRFGYWLPSEPVITQAEIKQGSYLYLRSEIPSTLHELLKVANKLINFLALGVDRTISMRNVSVYSERIKEEYGEGKVYEKSLPLYFESLSFSEVVPKISIYEMLFTYKDLAGKSQVIIERWLAAHERLMPAMNLYFGAIAGAHRFLNSRFLSMAQALETYHRRTSVETNMPENDFVLLKWSVVEASPEFYREFVAARLSYGNEISLMKRLRKMIAEFERYFGNKEQQKSLIASIVNTRNYFTHYDPELQAKAATGPKLWALCMKMEALFQLQLMKEIGLPSEAIADVVKNNGRLRQKLSFSE